MTTEMTYVVKGIWPFPADMLRHDGSRAATKADQDVIDSLCEEFAPDRSAFGEVEISLVGPNKPNTARWESFGWKVPGDIEHAFVKADRERRAAETALLKRALGKLDSDERTLVERLIARSHH